VFGLCGAGAPAREVFRPLLNVCGPREEADSSRLKPFGMTILKYNLGFLDDPTARTGHPERAAA